MDKSVGMIFSKVRTICAKINDFVPFLDSVSPKL